MTFTGTLTGITAALGVFDSAEAKVAAAMFRGVSRGVLGGQSIVRGNARGRPGPRAVTGDYNRSIVGDAGMSGTTVLGQIGSNAAQGRRLEYGFYGPDRLGRVYAQPPFAHYVPSVPAVRAVLITEVTSAIAKALG